MRIAIVGGRDFTDYALLSRYISIFTEKTPTTYISIVSGGAQGGDTFAEQFAREHRYDTQIFKPEWSKYGPRAGLIRNQLIVDACDMVVAFWDGKSRGTADTIAKAKKAKKPTLIIYY